jgi:hypothetical protein
MSAAEALTSSCQPWGFGISSAPSVSEAKPSVSAVTKAMLAALCVTLLQVVVAVGLLAPDGPLEYRYQTLIEHDSYWFMNIMDRGYQTTVPPIDHKVMEVSNVAFFPAYPLLAGALRSALDLDSANALLFVAQAAAFGFWCYFFLFCERWKLSTSVRWFGALAIAAHPAAFYLVAGYSESLFLMALMGFLYWSGAEGNRARVLAAVHGIVMSATRIVGIPCAAAPALQKFAGAGWAAIRHPIAWLREHRGTVAVAAISVTGAGAFFIYCQLNWGHWDIYMLTQSAGWSIDPDYLAVFRPSSYRWLIPSFDNPTEVSQVTMSLGGIVLLLAGVSELTQRFRGTSARIGLLFCAATIYFVSVSGVACVDMESMLRYEFSLHPLIVLAFLHFLRQLRTPPATVRFAGAAVVALGSAAGLCLQGWFVWNFTRGNWVA